MNNPQDKRLIELYKAATPGPWTFRFFGDRNEVVDAKGFTVCDDTAYYPAAVEVADQQLIAAMHTALPDLLNDISLLRQVANAARIMQATQMTNQYEQVTDEFIAASDHLDECLAKLKAVV